MPRLEPVLVLGAGAWGTALAVLLASHGVPVRLWAHRPEQRLALAEARTNTRRLPGVAFPQALDAAGELGEELERVADVLIASPFAALRELAGALAARPRPGRRVAWACKGLEPETLELGHHIVAGALGPGVPTAVVSGPTFAAEVAAGLPAAMVVASYEPAFAASLVARLHGPSFRAYSSDDVTGVEVGGAVKNVMAIAAGVADGLRSGANARAALVTRGLAEITRLGVALGARRETFMGLAGLGDLVLTCTDDQSRNRRLGLALARGRSAAQARAEVGLTEGLRSAPAVCALALRHGVEMPIADQVWRLVNGECSAREAVETLLARDPRPE